VPAVEGAPAPSPEANVAQGEGSAGRERPFPVRRGLLVARAPSGGGAEGGGGKAHKKGSEAPASAAAAVRAWAEEAGAVVAELDARIPSGRPEGTGAGRPIPGYATEALLGEEGVPQPLLLPCSHPVLVPCSHFVLLSCSHPLLLSPVPTMCFSLQEPVADAVLAAAGLVGEELHASLDSPGAALESGARVLRWAAGGGARSPGKVHQRLPQPGLRQKQRQHPAGAAAEATGGVPVAVGGPREAALGKEDRRALNEWKRWVQAQRQELKQRAKEDPNFGREWARRL